MTSVLRGTSIKSKGCCMHILSGFSSWRIFLQRCTSSIRTHLSDPTEHTTLQQGLFYSVPQDDVNKLMFNNWMSPHEKNMNKTFQEYCILIRRPALEIMDILRRINYNYPITRFLLYGEMNAGKKFTMTHVMHFCRNQNWITLTVPWANDWNCRRLKVSYSNHTEFLFDLPIHSKNLLEDFLIKNSHLIEDFKTSTRYEFSEQESSEQGVPLIDLVSFGISRMKFANDVVGALLQELKHLANNDKIKLLITVRGINAFWMTTGQRKEKVKKIHAQQLSLVKQFSDLLQSDTKNAVALCSVESWLRHVSDRDPYLPTDLLGKEGIDFLEPFIPVEVPKYNEEEIQKVMDYYEDRRWIQLPEAKTPNGRKQITYLSGYNPYKLYKVCVPL